MAKNTAAKGASIERRARDVLEADGYFVAKSVRSPVVRWLPHPVTRKMEQKILGSNSNDFFGAFDLIAVHPSKGCRFIQVTDSHNMGARMRKVELVVRKFPPFVFCEVWGWVGGAKRIDQRYKALGKRYLRRQYWRESVWRLQKDGPGWLDVTPPTAGWIDGYVPAEVRATMQGRTG